MKLEATQRLTAAKSTFPVPVVPRSKAEYNFRYLLELKLPGKDWWEVKMGSNTLDQKFAKLAAPYAQKGEVRVVDTKS